ncbi:MAG TPA: M67 family metallopeptidase [Kofleriaceae bacterium]|nr:M67 family metallopeptidase [Kofleriaceae bacterium]
MKPAAVSIPDAILKQIYRYARMAFPIECCGYLRGSGGGANAASADELVACTNAEPVQPERNFAIDGDDLFAFARTFRTPRPALVIYHSHTNGRAYFSETDRAQSATEDGPHYDCQHLVVGVTAAGVTEAAQFAWSSDDNDFVEIDRWSVAG